MEKEGLLPLAQTRPQTRTDRSIPLPRRRDFRQPADQIDPLTMVKKRPPTASFFLYLSLPLCYYKLVHIPGFACSSSSSQPAPTVGRIPSLPNSNPTSPVS